MKSVATSAGSNTWADLYKLLYELLERRQYLMPYAKEFSLIDSTLKNYFSGVPNCSIGEYKVSGYYGPERNCGAKNQNGNRNRRWIVEISKQKKD